MAFDYTKARATAEKIINNFGQSVTFSLVQGEGGFDDFGNPTTPVAIENTGLCTPALPMAGIMQALTPEEQSQVLKSDSYIFFHSTNPIEIGSTATIDGIEWRVKSIIKSLSSVDGTNVFRSYHLSK